MVEVATGVAHPPGGIWQDKEVSHDYSKVEVHTVKPEFSTHKIEHPTSEGICELGLVMKQFILWYKDIMLNVASPVLSDVHLERVVEEGEVYSPSHEDHMHETPHYSPNPIHDMAQPSPAHAKQRHDETSHVPHNPLPPSPTCGEPGHDGTPHEPHSPHPPSPARGEPGHDDTPHEPHSPHPSTAGAEPEHDKTLHVPPKPQPSPAHAEQGQDEMPQSSQQAQPTNEGHEIEVRECEAQKKIPVMIRPDMVKSTGSKSFVEMPYSGIYKWYAHD
jgi:hypothetical protein